jgi:preprotein translocase subunit SecD
MSSDYIPRLRSELLRAGATRQARFRPARALRPLAAAAAVAAIVAALVIAVPLGNDERADTPANGGVQIAYRVDPPAAAERTAQVMEARLSEAGIDDAHASVTSGGGLTIVAPASARADVAALAQPGRVAFYDWEASVLGPDGKPAPADTSVTGDPDAGHGAALSKAEAQARAADVPGARAVAGRDGAWFVLGGDPALTNADIQSTQTAQDVATHEPVVQLDLDARGQAAFTALTRELARRGADRALPGSADLDAVQHFAIVVDDQIVSVPYIDFRQAPDGVDGADGTHISNDLTPQSARNLASIIDTGPLPATLR